MWSIFMYKVQDYIMYKFKIRTLMFFTSYMKGLTYCSYMYVEYMYSCKTTSFH